MASQVRMAHGIEGAHVLFIIFILKVMVECKGMVDGVGVEICVGVHR